MSYLGRVYIGQMTQPGSRGPKDQASIPPGLTHHVTVTQHIKRNTTQSLLKWAQ